MSLSGQSRLSTTNINHRKAPPQRKAGGEKNAHHSFSITFSPPGFYKVILAHDAGQDTLQHGHFWAPRDILQNKYNNT